MPCDYKNYPKNWKAIRIEILARAGNRCEWADHEDMGSVVTSLRCMEYHGSQAQTFRGRVVLTIAHMNHCTKDSRRKNLKALCQLHHNRYDANHRAENRRKTWIEKRRLQYA